MVITVVLILLFLLLVYLLFTPLVVYIDTVNNNYYLQYKGLAKVMLLSDKKELIKMQLRVFFLNFYFYPLRKKKGSDKIKKIESKKPAKKKRTINFKTGLRLLKSFKVKTLYMNIDTGDCISNAKLYPVFAFLNYRYGGFYVNFDNRNQVILELQNRPIYIIKSFINN